MYKDFYTSLVSMRKGASETLVVVDLIIKYFSFFVDKYVSEKPKILYILLLKASVIVSFLLD